MKMLRPSWNPAWGFSLITFLILPGCFKPQGHLADDPRSGAATFAALEIKADGKGKIVKSSTDLALAEAKQIGLKACLVNRKTENPLPAGLHFLLSLRAESVPQEKDLVTDESGCVSWTESFKFEPVAEEVFIPLTRVLRASESSGYSGSRTLKIAVNPWNHSGAPVEVVDLKKSTVPEGSRLVAEDEVELALKGQWKSESKQPVGEPERLTKGLVFSRFEIHNFRTPVGAEEGTISRSLQVSLQPMIYFKSEIDAGGSLKPLNPITLSQADLVAKAVLIAEYVNAADSQTHRVYVWSSGDALPLMNDAFGKKLVLPVKFKIPNAAAVSYYLALRMQVPAESRFAKRLAPCDVVFELGSQTQAFELQVLPEKIKASNFGVGSPFNFESDLKSVNDDTPTGGAGAQGGNAVAAPSPTPAGPEASGPQGNH